MFKIQITNQDGDVYFLKECLIDNQSELEFKTIDEAKQFVNDLKILLPESFNFEIKAIH